MVIEGLKARREMNRLFTLQGLLALTGSIVLVLAVAVVPARAVDRVSPESAAQFVETLGNDALAILGAPDAAESESAREQLKLLMQRGFDLALIGRFVLGRFWRQATAGQQNEYQALFSKQILDSYAEKLSKTGGQGFSILGSKLLGETDALVKTRLESAVTPAVEASWRVRVIGGEHKVIDVVFEGVSMALSKREEFGAVLKREGVEGLLKRLRAKAASPSASPLVLS